MVNTTVVIIRLGGEPKYPDDHQVAVKMYGVQGGSGHAHPPSNMGRTVAAKSPIPRKSVR